VANLLATLMAAAYFALARAADLLALAMVAALA